MESDVLIAIESLLQSSRQRHAMLEKRSDADPYDVGCVTEIARELGKMEAYIDVRKLIRNSSQ